VKPGAGVKDGPTALYRYFDDKNRLLYIGITDNLFSREQGHIRSSHWMQLVASSTVQRHPDREDALVSERKAIEAERPLFNRQYNDTPAARERAKSYLEEIGRMDLYDPRRYVGRVPLGELEMKRSRRRRQQRAPVPEAVTAKDDEPGIKASPISRDQVILMLAPALQDNELSFAARGVLAFVMSLRNSVELTTEWLEAQRPNDEESVASALAELEACGYLRDGVISDVKIMQPSVGAA
jgi:hypothetical protein